MEFNSIENYPKNEIHDLYSFWFSIYPILYKELVSCERTRFAFKNIELSNLFIDIKNKNALDSVNNLTYSMKKNFKISLEENKILNDKKYIKEFLYIFFPFDKVTKWHWKALREPYLKDSYNKKRPELDDILWRHDGWWNCYYGKIHDTEAIPFLKKEYKNAKTNVKKTKFALTLSYRYTENNQIRKARKLLRKNKKLLKVRLFFDCLMNKDGITIPTPVKNNLYYRFKYVYNAYYQMYARYHINIYMLLYRSSKNKRQQKRIINKILRVNKLGKLIMKTEKGNPFYTIFSNLRLWGRPQHLLRLAEVRIDKYSLTKQKKLIEEIKYILAMTAQTIGHHYYKGKSIIEYFIINEFYFTIYYFLKKVYNYNLEKDEFENEE